MTKKQQKDMRTYNTTNISGRFCILIVDLIRAPRSDLLNVVVLRWRRHVLRLRVEDGGVGGGPGAARVIGGEGGQRPPKAGVGRVLHGVEVGGEHRRGGLCGDSPTSKRRITTLLSLHVLLSCCTLRSTEIQQS